MKVYSRRQAMADNYLGKAPRGYVWVDYIQNTSNAYIDTGCYPDSDTEVELLMENLSNAAYKGVMGVGRTGNYRWGIDIHASSGTEARFYWGNGAVSIGTIPTSSLSTIKISGKTITLNNRKTTINATWTGGALSNPIYLFRMYSGATGCALMKLHGQTTIKTGGVLRRDYRPIKRLSDNKYGLWDNVSKSFFTSPNGTNFVGGGKYLSINNLCRIFGERRAA